MKIPGGSPKTNRALKSEKAGKGTKSKTSFSIPTSLIEQIDTIDETETVDATDSPFYQEMQQQAQQLKQGETDLEEATKAVVTAMLIEHFGKKNISPKVLNEMINQVSSSMNEDGDIQSRIEEIMLRLSK